jgi:hypothetical protein
MCAKKMPALNKMRTPTPNSTIELTAWPRPTLASDMRAARASERLVRYLNSREAGSTPAVDTPVEFTIETDPRSGRLRATSVRPI